MRITTKLAYIDEDLRTEIKVKIENNAPSDIILRPAMYEAILRAMRDSNKKAFYTAMSSFAEEDFDSALEFLSNEDEDDDEE